MSKSKNNYFHESQVFPLWEKHYKNNQPLTPAEEKMLWDIPKGQITKTVNGVIFTHRQQKFGIEFEDIQAQALAAIHKALYSFDPDFITTKGKRATLFNYISLTAYRAIKYYTIKQNTNKDLELHDYALNDKHYYDKEPFDVDGLKRTLVQVVNECNETDFKKVIFKEYIDHMIVYLETTTDPLKSRLSTYLRLNAKNNRYYRHLFFNLLKENQNILEKFIE